MTRRVATALAIVLAWSTLSATSAFAQAKKTPKPDTTSDSARVTPSDSTTAACHGGYLTPCRFRERYRRDEARRHFNPAICDAGVAFGTVLGGVGGALIGGVITLPMELSGMKIRSGPVVIAGALVGSIAGAYDWFQHRECKRDPPAPKDTTATPGTSSPGLGISAATDGTP